MNTACPKETDKRKYKIEKNKYNLSLKETISDLITFLEDISDLISQNGHLSFFNKSNKIFRMKTELIDSSVFTLNSISICSEFGSFGDLNTLLRKYRDDLFLYLYFLEICNNSNNPLGDIDYIDYLKTINDEETHAFNWIDNKLENLQIGYIIGYLLKNKTIFTTIKKYNLKSNWERISKILNNYVHANGIKYVESNFHPYTNYEQEYSNFESHLLELTLVFTTLLILIKPNFISSTDYTDYLEMGLEPPENSQFFVAPFIENFINEKLENRFSDIKEFLRSNTSMDIK